MCEFLDYEDYADPHNFGARIAPFLENSFIFTQFETDFVIMFFCDMSFGKYKKHLEIIAYPPYHYLGF